MGRGSGYAGYQIYSRQGKWGNVTGSTSRSWKDDVVVEWGSIIIWTPLPPMLVRTWRPPDCD